LVEALEQLDLSFPKVGQAQLKEMKRIRKARERGRKSGLSQPPLL
jgi:hypothetical protein